MRCADQVGADRRLSTSDSDVETTSSTWDVLIALLGEKRLFRQFGGLGHVGDEERAYLFPALGPRILVEAGTKILDIAERELHPSALRIERPGGEVPAPADSSNQHAESREGKGPKACLRLSFSELQHLYYHPAQRRQEANEADAEQRQRRPLRSHCADICNGDRAISKRRGQRECLIGPSVEGRATFAG